MPLIKLIVDGGNMKLGPAVSQQLGPMGINLGKVIEEVNKATAGFKGMKVPVELDVNPKTKDFTLSVSSPPVSELIKKELKVEKGSERAGSIFIGNLAIEQIIGIAKTKMSDMLAKDLKAAVKLTIGSCVPLGVFIENKPAKELIEDIEKGKYDSEISGEKTTIDDEKKEKLEKFFSKVKAKQEEQTRAEAEAKEAEEAAKAEAATQAEPEEKKEEPKKDDRKKK